MSNHYLRTAGVLALLAATGGCATTSGPPTQQLEVHTILDHREVAGVGCLLSSSAGRWFVVAPGRVTIERSRDPLTIDCARAGTGSAREVALARSTSLFDSGKLFGQLVVSAGIDGYFSHDGGAGVAYQPTLTVLMQPAEAPAGAAAASSNDVLF